MSFLHLQHPLHELHLVGERRVGEGLQIGFEIALQQLVPSVKTFGKRTIALLHLRRLGEERSKE